MNLNSFNKFGFIKLNFKETNVDIKKLSEKILTEFLKFNFLNYPAPPFFFKNKNIYEYINYIYRIDVKKNNTRLTSNIYKFLPTLISLNEFAVSSDLLRIIQLIMKKEAKEVEIHKKKKEVGIKEAALTLGTCPLIRIDRPLDKKYKTPWHQDYWFSGISPESIVFWAPLGNLNKKMGFIEAIPGPQDYGILSIKKNKYHEPFQPQKKINENLKVILDCKFGEFLIFKQSLLHKSGINISNKCRVSLQLRFNKFCKNEEPQSSYVPKTTEFVKNMQKNLLKVYKKF